MAHTHDTSSMKSPIEQVRGCARKAHDELENDLRLGDAMAAGMFGMLAGEMKAARKSLRVPSHKLDYFLQSQTFQNIAVIGTPESCVNCVLEELGKLNLEYDHIVNVSSMPSLEEIHRHQRKSTVIREGNAIRPTFIRSVLATYGFQKMPKVLVLSAFNSVPSEQTYFLKALLDKKAREEDNCYDQLLAIILIMAPVDEQGAFDVDPDVRGCISAIVDLRLGDVRKTGMFGMLIGIINAARKFLGLPPLQPQDRFACRQTP